MKKQNVLYNTLLMVFIFIVTIGNTQTLYQNLKMDMSYVEVKDEMKSNPDLYVDVCYGDYLFYLDRKSCAYDDYDNKDDNNLLVVTFRLNGDAGKLGISREIAEDIWYELTYMMNEDGYTITNDSFSTFMVRESYMYINKETGYIFGFGFPINKRNRVEVIITITYIGIKR